MATVAEIIPVTFVIFLLSMLLLLRKKVYEFIVRSKNALNSASLRS